MTVANSESKYENYGCESDECTTRLEYYITDLDAQALFSV